MSPSRDRRGAAARVIGWGVVAAAYALVLAWASGMTADPAAAEATTTTEVAGVLAPAPAEVEAVSTVTTTPAAVDVAGPAEEPVVTLALASAMVLLAGLGYLAHAILGRSARHLRREREGATRIAIRHITTLL